jgi:hypothetical protein
MTDKAVLRAGLKSLKLTGADRAHVLDALEEAFSILDSDELVMLVSQQTIDKIQSSIVLLRGNGK